MIEEYIKSGMLEANMKFCSQLLGQYALCDIKRDTSMQFELVGRIAEGGCCT